MDKIGKIIKTILFSLIVAAMALVANRILMPNTDFSADVSEGCENPDYIMLGASNIFMAVNPVVIWDEAGLVGYDVSSEQAPLIMSYYYLKDALKKHKPKYVFLDCVAFRYNYGDPAMNQLSINKLPWNKDKVSLIGNIGLDKGRAPYPKIYYVFPLLKFHSRWKDLIMDGRDTYHDRYEITFMGYVPSKDVFVYKKQHNWLPDSEELEDKDKGLTEVSTITEKWFLKILGLCRSNNIELVMLKTPSKMWTSDLHDAMYELAKQNKVEYLDLNEGRYIRSIGIDESTDFADGFSHYNITGTERISRWLANYMVNNWDMESRRDDVYYAGIWDAKYLEYLAYKEN